MWNIPVLNTETLEQPLLLMSVVQSARLLQQGAGGDVRDREEAGTRH